MTDPAASSFLDVVEILTAEETFHLRESGGSGGRPGPLSPPRNLASQAMRWTYVLRARERWLGKGNAQLAHEADAAATLLDFGLDDAALQRLANASRVVVRMPYRSEVEGWASRIFPWEYVIASATRRHRRADDRHFTVMRELQMFPPPAWKPNRRGASFLFVQSAPGGLRREWTFDDELRRITAALGNINVEVLADPTLEQLEGKVRSMRPDLVHLSGFDNLEGLKALRDISHAREVVEVEANEQRLTDLLASERYVPDGMLLAGKRRGAAVVSALELAAALRAGGHCAYFIGVSMQNSAARTAALLVGERAALASVGFQDSIENALVDYFFELIYTQLSKGAWNLPLAFEQAWLSTRQKPEATRATGIALWAGNSLTQPKGAQRVEARPAELPVANVAPYLQCVPEKELNYSVLHNNGPLFSRFVVQRGNAAEGDWLDIDVELHLGAESARYRRRFKADKTPFFDLANEVHVPLTASLMRSCHEAVNSALVVQLSHNDELLSRETYRLRLLPVDQWRDNDKDGQWLPSFVLPRDPAVVRAIEQAQHYVRVLRDNPSAGFEGYQAAPSAEEEQLFAVDLQVQAVWAALVHEWRLGYINPPPTYSSNLDSQRLRTPSTVLGGHSGTCIDLALLFAACLELIDIYPVIFLLNGHALPGYWRHHAFQDDYRTLRTSSVGAKATSAGEAAAESSGTRQQYSWQAVGPGAYREISELIQARQLVPIETVRLTEYCGFVEAIESGIAALAEAQDFHSVLDLGTARVDGITPLPIDGGPV
jgi:hypothetical protein